MSTGDPEVGLHRKVWLPFQLFFIHPWKERHYSANPSSESISCAPTFYTTVCCSLFFPDLPGNASLFPADPRYYSLILELLSSLIRKTASLQPILRSILMISRSSRLASDYVREEGFRKSGQLGASCRAVLSSSSQPFPLLASTSSCSVRSPPSFSLAEC